MPAISPLLRFHGFPTLFGRVRDTKITFVVDTSQSMHGHLGAIKFHLKEALLAKAYTTPDSGFNIVEFSNKVTKWCDCMVTCNPQTIFSAMQWFQSLSCAQGRDLLSALTAAFDDPVCEAFYLVTNGLPDNMLKDIFHVLPYISHGRPIHTFYLSDKWIDGETREFLQETSRLTQGSAHLIKLNNCGAIKQVAPIYPASTLISGPQYSDLKYCTTKTPLEKSPFTDSCIEYSDAEAFHMHPVNLNSPMDSASIYKYTDPWVGLLGSSRLVFGASVLARQESDGFFHMGTIKQEVRKGLFLIEFEKSTLDQDSKCQSFVQQTAIYDIIQHNEAMRHSVVQGDKILAPWESDGVRYGPGIVVFGIETRDPLQVMEDDEISVKFWNGKTVKVSKNVAVWIPPAMYERILQELLAPLLSRQHPRADKLTACHNVCLQRPQTELACVCNFGPVNIQPSCSAFPGLDPSYNYWHGFYHGFHSLPVHLPCYCFPEVISPAGWWPLTSKCTNSKACDQDELEKKIALQLQELDVPKKNSSNENLLSSSEDSDSSPETSKPALEDRAVNTDSLLEKRRIKARDRPEWRYWSQSHQEPHRRKPETSLSSRLRSAPDFSHLESSTQLQNLGPTNCNAMFESIDHGCPQKKVTMKEVLTHQKQQTTSSTGMQGPPIQERLGESQLSRDRRNREAVQRSRMIKLHHHLWEKDREQQCEEKYQSIQENHRWFVVVNVAKNQTVLRLRYPGNSIREKVLQRLENNFKQMQEREQKLEKMERAKRCLHQKTQSRIQSIAQEDKETEDRRLAHLQQVTTRKNMREAERMKANEIKNIRLQEARRKRVEQHNKMVAKKFHEAESKAD